MFMPKKVKYRKMHKQRGNLIRRATTKTGLDFGSVGLKALESG